MACGPLSVAFRSGEPLVATADELLVAASLAGRHEVLEECLAKAFARRQHVRAVDGEILGVAWTCGRS